MANITGPEFGGVVAGGEAAGGNYIWLTIRLGDQNQTMIIEKSRVAVLMAGLATAAGMARTARMRSDPNEANNTGMDAVYALDLDNAGVGRHSEPGKAILDLRIDAKGQEMNLYLSATPNSLVRLRAACSRAILQIKNRAAKRKQGEALN